MTIITYYPHLNFSHDTIILLLAYIQAQKQRGGGGRGWLGSCGSRPRATWLL